MASRKVYSMKEFLEVISIQEQNYFQNPPFVQPADQLEEQLRLVDDDGGGEEHPLVTEMFGELYFRESPTSTLDALFSPRMPPDSAAPKEKKPSEEAAKKRRKKDDSDHGNGNNNKTPKDEK